MPWSETEDPEGRDPCPDKVVPASAQHTNSDEPEATILTPHLPY